GMALTLSFAPVGSRLIVVRPGAPLAVAPTWQEKQRLSLDQWQISRSEPNALVLDYCRYRIGDGPWSERAYVRRAWEEIRAHYGLNTDRHNTRERFWSILEKMRPVVGDPRVTLALNFDLDSPAAAQSLCLVMETPERFQISVNGQVVSSASKEFWRDRSLRKIAIGQAVRQGENEILLVCPEWREDSELETSFLTGDFRVEKRGEGFVLTTEATLPQGDWTAQGYPFYAGSFRYAQEVELDVPGEGEKLFLEVPQWKGAVLRVTVNEGAPILLGWPPYRADITDRVHAGKNRIQVEVVNTFRNLMGPHHQAQLSQGLTAPATFYTPENWSDDYSLWSYGLTGPVALVREAIQ
ncbi:MAG TPA: hypothetical protein VHR86_06685, partial [Armatimonadota bacterium]|nr:hypothetical protein [Armatimonadota bacterium]